MLDQLRFQARIIATTFTVRNSVANPAAPLTLEALDQTRLANLARIKAKAAKLKALFRTSVRRIIHLLRIRRRWAATGLALQEPRCRDLFSGVKRVAGTLVRFKRQQ
jgi:hypothetical protein